MVNPPSRIIVKLSGEALGGFDLRGAIDPQILERIVAEVKEAKERTNVEVGIVVGGGNLFRGETLSKSGINRISADHIGMLGTMINGIVLREMFEKEDVSTRIMSAIPMSGVVDQYDRRKAIHHLRSGRVVIFTGGQGNPLVTTDSAASLRAIELNADMLVKGSQVNGIYSDDPRKNADAEFYSKVSFDTVVAEELKVMDLAAFCQCRDHNLTLRVFSINTPGLLCDILCGKEVGTLVVNE